MDDLERIEKKIDNLTEFLHDVAQVLVRLDGGATGQRLAIAIANLQKARQEIENG